MEVINMKGYQALPVERCGNCKYFRKHYLRAYKGCYRATNYGHCVHPRLKTAGRRNTVHTGQPQKKAPAVCDCGGFASLFYESARVREKSKRSLPSSPWPRAKSPSPRAAVST